MSAVLSKRGKQATWTRDGLPEPTAAGGGAALGPILVAFYVIEPAKMTNVRRQSTLPFLWLVFHKSHPSEE
jgi:hypothetical protein